MLILLPGLSRSCPRSCLRAPACGSSSTTWACASNVAQTWCWRASAVGTRSSSLSIIQGVACWLGHHSQLQEMSSWAGHWCSTTPHWKASAAHAMTWLALAPAHRPLLPGRAERHTGPQRLRQNHVPQCAMWQGERVAYAGWSVRLLVEGGQREPRVHRHA